MPVRDPSGPYVECKVSPEDYALARSHPWRLNADAYVIVHVYDVIRKTSTLLSLHRMVARAPAGVLVDHVRANLLDCRRCALRRATHTQNTANRRKLLANKTSRYRGVTEHKGGRWQAAAKHHDKFIHGGLHDTQEQAAAAYNAIARRIWGRFSVLNRLAAKHGVPNDGHHHHPRQSTALAAGPCRAGVLAGLWAARLPGAYGAGRPLLLWAAQREGCSGSTQSREASSHTERARGCDHAPGNRLLVVGS